MEVTAQPSQPTVDFFLSRGRSVATSEELDEMSSLRQRLSKVDSKAYVGPD